MPTTAKRAAVVLIVILGLSGHRKQEPGKDGKPAPTPVPAPTTAALSRITPEKVFEVVGAQALLATGDAVWVASKGVGVLTRIDPKASTVAATVTIEASPCGGLAEGFGAIWAPLCGPKPALARIDLKTNKTAVTITRGLTAPAGAPAIAVASVWLLTDTKTIGRFDPDTNTQVAEMYLPSAVTTLTFGQGALWAVGPQATSLFRINPNTNLLVETIKVGPKPRAIAIGEGAVWTLNEGDATVSRVDPKTNKVAETIKLNVAVSPTGGQIVAGEGSVWVTTAGTPLLRIDPRTNRVVQIFTDLAAGGALAIGHGSLWLTAGPKAVWRIDPKRVEATR